MGDLDSTLHKGLLVAFINQDPGQASRILRSAVTERLSRPQDISNGPAGAADMAQVYMWLREAQAASILNTKVDVLTRGGEGARLQVDAPRVAPASRLGARVSQKALAALVYSSSGNAG
jgi:hypothetical protein